MRLRVPLLPGWIRWTAVIGLAGFIFYVSILTIPPETPVDTWKPMLLPLDKWRHFVAYAALGGSLAYATTSWKMQLRYRASIVMGATVLYGVGIEAGQSVMPQRHFSLGDAYANAFGALLITPWYLVRSHIEFVPIRTWLQEFPDVRADTD